MCFSYLPYLADPDILAVGGVCIVLQILDFLVLYVHMYHGDLDLDLPIILGLGLGNWRGQVMYIYI